MTPPDLTFGVIICTYNRKSILQRALQHWQQSIRRPDQFLVIDATSQAEQYLEELIDKNRSLFSESASDYIVSQQAGTSLQRNIGLERIKTDIVCMVDDDTFVTPNYVNKIVDLFQRDTGQLIGGVNGVSIGQFNNPRQRYFREAKNFLRHRFGYLAQRIHIPKSQTRLFQPLPAELTSLPLIAIDRLWGANMNYRRSALGDLRFDENFKRYGLYEDVELSVRVGQTHKFVCRIDAEIMHDDDLGKTTRPSDIRYFLASWLNSAYIIEKLFPCDESRNAHQRLFNLSRLISSSLSPEKRRHKLKTLGNTELFQIAESYSNLLRKSAQQQQLGETFAELQENDYSHLA